MKQLHKHFLLIIFTTSLISSSTVFAMDERTESRGAARHKMHVPAAEPELPQRHFVMPDLGNASFDEKRGQYYFGIKLDELPPLQAAVVPSVAIEDQVIFELNTEDDGLGTATFSEDGILEMGASLPTGQSAGGQSAEAPSADTPESVIGGDGRKRVKNYNKWPHRVHGHIVMEYGGGSNYIGSGTLINGDSVITAGHNFFDRDTGRSVKRATFYPGMDKGHVPWKSIGKSFSVHPAYYDRSSNKYADVDMAVLRLASPLGDKLGYFGLSLLPNDTSSLEVNVTGYPGDRDRGKRMYTMSGSIKRTEDERFYYTIDTAGGQSGSGVWALVGTDYDVYGIHCYGGTTQNSATRLTDKKLALVAKWTQ